MRIKSYFVPTVDEAIAQARAEFGEDALLLSTRQTGRRLRSRLRNRGRRRDRSRRSGLPTARARSASVAKEPRPWERSTPEIAGRSDSRNHPRRDGRNPSTARFARPARRPRSRAGRGIRSPDRRRHRRGAAGQIVDARRSRNGDARSRETEDRVALGLGRAGSTSGNSKSCCAPSSPREFPSTQISASQAPEGTVWRWSAPAAPGRPPRIMKIAAFQAGPDASGSHSSRSIRTRWPAECNCSFSRARTGVAFTALESPES